jgi:DNA-binding SARP family transcriptional activator
MPNAVIGHSAGYALNVDPVEIDAHRFEMMLRSAPSDNGSAATFFRAALDLWRGDALLGLASENPLFAAKAVRLESLRSTALENRIEAELGAGMERILIPELRVLTSQSPLNENLCGYLMLALARAGQPSEALRAYRNLRGALVTELGMEPSESIQRLELAILNQDIETLESFIH